MFPNRALLVLIILQQLDGLLFAFVDDMTINNKDSAELDWVLRVTISGNPKYYSVEYHLIHHLISFYHEFSTWI